MGKWQAALEVFKSIPSLIAGALIGAVGMAVWFHYYPVHAKAEGEIEGELHLGQSGFINPLIDCPQMPEGRSPKKDQIQKSVSQRIDELQNRKVAEKVSVGYRDLNNGPAFSINVDEPFMAASLLKVPIAIAILKKSLGDTSLMSRKLIYVKPSTLDDWSQAIQIADPMVPGSSYTVEELIRRMLVDSDNEAAAMLLNVAPPLEVIQVLREMGVPLLQKNNDWWISVGEYGSIFRILYNSTFLPESMSNSLLRLLSQAKGPVGLISGIESGITVSHKFGERRSGDLQQFHDCGIIYYPKRPYLLCVMTRGADLKQLETVVADISKIVFEEVKKQTR